MAEMNFLEKLLVNNPLYNYLYRKTFLRWFLDKCELKGDCLEIGCGPGYTTAELKRRFRIKLTSIDIDEKELEIARKRLGDSAEILQADARKLPFKDNSFDCVIEMNAFHHIEDYKEAIAECRRVLKKGGSFYLLDIGRYFFWPVLQAMEHFDGSFTREEMENDLRKAGFEIKKASGKNLFSIHAIAKR
ncbi:MAG: class I SAM-dependent methyltransferase [Candidatus Micrarchaeia archaeon]